MELLEFKILNFRSIQETRWLPFSPDGTTAIVGQNESGKSSIIDALELGFSTNSTLKPEDVRLNDNAPRIGLRVVLSPEEARLIASSQPSNIRPVVERVLGKRQAIEFWANFEPDEGDEQARIFSFSPEVKAELAAQVELERLERPAPSEMVEIVTISRTDSAKAELEDDEEALAPSPGEYSEAGLLSEFWAWIPVFLLFRDEQCQLPNRIDISFQKLAKGTSDQGALNFLAASDVDLKQLISWDERRRSSALSKASELVTKRLQEFWSQVLGKTRRIRLECELKFYPATESAKAGEPYLAFWVVEGSEKLYPSQRSKGTRWFISFFLQLMAEQSSGSESVFLLDEPGAFLHATAQADVVKLIEHLSENMRVVYTTHSPYLLDHRKLHRILAVEREEADAESLTVVKTGLEIATASPLTLAPVLALIGVDLSQQQVIKRSGNVILEEVSAYYYFMAFVKLLGVGTEISWVAAGGVDNVKLLADLFIAWGIQFVVLVDDDAHGKKVCREIKAKYSLSDAVAKKQLRRVEGNEAIEDIFTPQEFRDVVAKGHIIPPIAKNGEAMKQGRVSKPLVAVSFWRRVQDGEILKAHLSEETLGQARALIQSISNAH